MSSVLVGPVDAACASSPSPSMSTFVIFSSPSERSRLCRNSSRPPKRSVSSSLGIRPLSGPSAVRPPMRPLPEACAPIGPTVRIVGRVPPSGFLTPSAACSASALRVCCAPLPAMGSVAFPGARPTISVEMGTNLPFPAPRYTLRRVPLVSSRAASLRSLPPCRCRPSSRSHPPGGPGFRRTSRTSSLASFAARSRLAPFRVDRPSSEEERREWTSDGRSRRTSPRSQGDRSHSGRRPKPPESPRVPPASAEAGAEPPFAEARGGASVVPSRPPPRWRPFGSGLRAPRALRVVRCLPKQVRCHPGGCSVPTEAGIGGPAGRWGPAAEAVGLHRGRSAPTCRSRPMRGRSQPERAG
jgi:hypothetical protein